MRDEPHQLFGALNPDILPYVLRSIDRFILAASSPSSLVSTTDEPDMDAKDKIPVQNVGGVLVSLPPARSISTRRKMFKMSSFEKRFRVINTPPNS